MVEILAGVGTSLAGAWWGENSDLEGDWWGSSVVGELERNFPLFVGAFVGG